MKGKRVNWKIKGGKLVIWRRNRRGCLGRRRCEQRRGIGERKCGRKLKILKNYERNEREREEREKGIERKKCETDNVEKRMPTGRGTRYL